MLQTLLELATVEKLPWKFLDVSTLKNILHDLLRKRAVFLLLTFVFKTDLLVEEIISFLNPCSIVVSQLLKIKEFKINDILFHMKILMPTGKKTVVFYMISVVEPPTVNVPVPSNNVDFGNSVTLTCTVTANPPHTIVYWRKLRNGITTNINVAQSGGKYAGSTVSNPSLQINNAQLDDQGSYTCYAQNSVGTGQSTPTALLVTGSK